MHSIPRNDSTNNSSTEPFAEAFLIVTKRDGQFRVANVGTEFKRETDTLFYDMARTRWYVRIEDDCDYTTMGEYMTAVEQYAKRFGESSAFNPYILTPALTDCDLLAIFVESLNDYAFIDFIADGISDLWGDEDHPAMNAQLHILKEALRLAAARGAGGAE
jgi:hypothetical protein